MAQHNLPAQSLDPLPKNPTLFGYFEDSEVRFENTSEDFGRIFGEVMMGEYGVPLSLTDDGVRMLLMPTGAIIEEDTVRLTYQYAESGGVSVLAVSLTGDACTCEVLHLMGGEGVSVSWDKITDKPEGVEAALVVLSGSPAEASSYTEDIISQISAAVEKSARLVLEWASECVVADYVGKSSNPVLSFRLGLVSYTVTLDMVSNTASVESVSALTQANVKDSAGDSATDVMSQQAVTNLVKGVGMSAFGIAGDPSLAASWTPDIIETVSTMVSNGAHSLLIVAPAQFGSYLSTKLYAYEYSEKSYVEIDYVNEDVKYAVVLNVTDKTAEVSALSLGGVTKIAMDTAPYEAAAWTESVRGKLKAAVEAGDVVILNSENESVPVILVSDAVDTTLVMFTGGDEVYFVAAVPQDTATPVTVSQVLSPVVEPVELSGDIATVASWDNAKEKVKSALNWGKTVYLKYGKSVWITSSWTRSDDGSVEAVFVGGYDNIVVVKISNENVVTIENPALLNEGCIAQEPGAATDKIMSQDAVTKKLINTFTLTGDVTGTGTPADGALSVATTIHGAAKTVTLTGAVTGSGTADDGVATVSTTLSGGAVQ